MTYKITQEVVDGIERITYRPENPIYQTPLIFQHGAWHGAWCWRYWQALFAEWGWVSHAHSLPTHGKSARKRPIRLCTLGYYQDVLKQQVEACEQAPVVIGHSMGGAVTQWYLSHVGDLPAAVIVASMPLYDYPWRYLFLDPLGMSMATLTWHGYPLVRSPERVKALFLSDNPLMSAEELHKLLDDESLVVPLELNPFTWHPRRNPQTPILVMAAEKDALFSVREEETLAKYYGGEFYLIKGTAHNAMIERSYQASAEYLQQWLLGKGIH
ncbi:MAG: alpha/beta hydrolase [Anaerolineae bacterium]|nr:alpha/beta hydrolase [Anaerolineae bacterium]